MDHLDEISLEELHEALENVEGKKPTKRLLAAIAYKNGVTQTELAEWYGTGRRTIYNWLKRFDTEEPLKNAVTDDKRTGRRRKLSDKQRKKFEDAVHNSPSEAGIDAPAWTPALAQQYLADTFDVEYSIPSCRRLLKEAGLSYRKPQRQSAATGDDGQEDEEDSKRRGGRWTPE